MTTRSFRTLAAALALGVFAVLLTPSSPATAAPSEFTVQGKGWGHGLGMSQHAANNRANDGHSYQQIVDFYYPGTTLQTQSMPTDLRILLATTGSSTITPTGGRTSIWLDGTKIFSEVTTSPIVVTRNGSKFNVTHGGSSLCPSGGCTASQVHVDFKNGFPARVSSTGRSYSWGRFTFSRSTSSMYVVLDRLPMERYLYGLGEMPSSWHPEALKVQAVAGRSYALEAVQRRRTASSWTRPWDLYASTQDQAFVGTGQEVSKWTSQVDATAGVVATYGGKPIQAFYSSSNGGHSELSSYVFSASLPYIAARPDSYDAANNQFATWSRTYTTAQISKWLNAYGDTAVGTLESISVSGNIGASGRTNKATVTLKGTSGTKTVNGNRFMVVVNVGTMNDGLGLTSQIMSTLYTVGSSGDNGGGSGGGSGGSTDPVDPAAPTGYFDRAVADGPGVARAEGWAADASSPSTALSIHFYVNGSFAGSVKANRSRPDVGNYTGLGNNHGWSAKLDLGAGTHEVCAYAINVGPTAPNPLMGCRNVTLDGSAPATPAPTDPGDSSPLGYFDRVLSEGGGVVRADGWAADPDAADSAVRVRFYVDGGYWGSVNANRSRPDVGNYTGLGNNHGWTAQITTGGGNHEVCAYAINIGSSAAHSNLGCIRVDA